jgi:primosomal protein N' (replication factor Y)
MQKSARWYGQALELKLHENVLGPEQPSIGRIRNQFITHILVKIPKKQSISKTKEVISRVQRSFDSIKEFSSVRVIVDVDNY